MCLELSTLFLSLLLDVKSQIVCKVDLPDLTAKQDRNTYIYSYYGKPLLIINQVYVVIKIL